jgi:hypothetical protein
MLFKARDHVMSKLTIALCISAFAFGSASAQVDDADKNAPEGKAALKSPPAPKKDWQTRQQKQEATAKAARERGQGVKQAPLVGDFGTPREDAMVRPKADPRTSKKEKEKEKERVKQSAEPVFGPAKAVP